MPASRFAVAALLSSVLILAACGPTSKTPDASPPPPPPQPGPTGFLTSDLVLPTLEESPGDATISVTVTNTGNVEASHDLKLVIDGTVITTKYVTLAAGASTNVTFSTILDHAGTHNVTIDQVSGKLRWDGPN